MSSRWTKHRREKRKYEEYIHGDVRPSTSKASTSSTIISSSGTTSSQELESKADISLDSEEEPDQSYEEWINVLDNTSDSSDSEVEPDNKRSITGNESAFVQTQIQDWAIKYQISHSALRELLGILNNNYDSHIPLDPRTLCKTPSHLSDKIKQICGGEYFHFGLQNALREFLELCSDKQRSNITTIFLKVNCDGIPLFKSSAKQFWPLLVQICTDCEMMTASDPFPVGVFLGESKPSNLNDYLKEFIEEVVLLKDGYYFKGVNYSVTIHCFICDAPARQFLKCIISHTGYNSCERCMQCGFYDQTIVFPEIDSPLRTDENFSSMTDGDHHKGVSPLTKLDIGLVTQFVLDPMHLIYLGVTRKLLHLWLKGPLPTRIGLQCKEKISTKLVELSKFMPMEFSRKPRSLNYLDRYKATEYRAFLLYTGPVCLINSVDINIYKNFLLLSSSITILSQHCDPQNVEVSKKYLTAFIKHFEQLFGLRHMVYNIHNLIHLPDDVCKYGYIDKFSAFPFENYLGMLKRLLRKPNCILSQIVNRIHEKKCCTSAKQETTFPFVKQEHTNGPLLSNDSCLQFKTLYLERFCVQLNISNNCIMVKNEVSKVLNIVQYSTHSDFFVLYHTFTTYEDLYDYPLKSGSLGIYIVSNESKTLKSCSCKEIQKKYMLFPLGTKYAAFPLIHTSHQQ